MAQPPLRANSSQTRFITSFHNVPYKQILDRTIENCERYVKMRNKPKLKIVNITHDRIVSLLQNTKISLLLTN